MHKYSKEWALELSSTKKRIRTVRPQHLTPTISRCSCGCKSKSSVHAWTMPYEGNDQDHSCNSDLVSQLISTNRKCISMCHNCLTKLYFVGDCSRGREQPKNVVAYKLHRTGTVPLGKSGRACQESLKLPSSGITFSSQLGIPMW
jgi:hypothetical protein